jgi:AhpD family alkylhydroperoxidase
MPLSGGFFYVWILRLGIIGHNPITDILYPQLSQMEDTMSQRLNYAKLSANSYKKLYDLSTTNKEGALSPTMIDLVNIRASQLNGCAFCLDMHVKEATIHGEHALRLHHVAIWRESTLFTAKERAALEWTEAVTKIAEHGTTDEVFARISEELSEKEIADLTFAIATINAWNRLAVSFNVVPGSADAAFGLDKAGLSYAA